MRHEITEIQIVPIKPKDGLVGFASLVLDSAVFLGSIGIMTRPSGGYRLVYPTKKAGNHDLNMFYPINREVGQMIEEAVIARFEKVMNESHDRHDRIVHSAHAL